MASRSSPPPSRRPPLLIAGAGRLGGALALSLSARRWPVRVLSRTEAGRARVKALGLKPATDQDVRQARVCLLCVPDSAIPGMARELDRQLGRGAALVHCAGALSLDALGAPQGRPLGSFHPLCAVSDPRDVLAGHSVALSTRSRTLKAVLRRMADALDLHVLEVPESQRAAYHAGAVLSAGCVVALLSAAVEALGCAGIAPQEALTALLPLTRSAVRGMEARGLAGGLTGPIARGDAEIVARHLAALPPDVAELYRQLSQRALVLAGPRLPEDARAALATWLAAPGSVKRPA
ncbi:Rossmann-like and DUF2520 domain-containing protein [Stigmatella erecta]|uniref:Predicted oxidoreductase, contains short-chain dehydrogenase (SDR) and DUF2520 domains n=1 Tax=Stigmatella erecta TaxID=83460 RepID=A0A1H9Z4R6_9BACT|nr:Rossmann-like and DUF2520 domain-containing protein [Stigmatella erecta]SES76499.1 Predicted oxidoreductase, contains short-chain dehydrogenase (SDR) and DUF2520 domains [Stigmatella erecta]